MSPANWKNRTILTGRKNQGWDAQAISRTAKEVFGGYREMFEYHGWPERGSKMMPNAGKRIKEHYGSVENFVVRFNILDE